VLTITNSEHHGDGRTYKVRVRPDVVMGGPTITLADRLKPGQSVTLLLRHGQHLDVIECKQDDAPKKLKCVGHCVWPINCAASGKCLRNSECCDVT
jgi:hypothetical protein